MWKKPLGILVILVSFSVPVFAAIPRDRMHIGGLKPGMTLQQVAAMYGMPQKVKSPSKDAVGMYDIAGGLISGWIDSKINAFTRYSINEEQEGSGRINASGDIYIGMPVSEVERNLGKPDAVGGNGKSLSYFYHSVDRGLAGREHDSLNVFFNDGEVRTIAINVF